MELGKRITARMKALGLTQAELAQRAELTQQAISKYIRGKSKPGYEAIVALAQALDVQPTWFFEREDTGIPPFQRDRLPESASIHESLPKPSSADLLVFPTTSRRITRGNAFVIGHWLPMQEVLPPSRAFYAGIATNFYALIFNSLAERQPSGRLRGSLAIDWKPTSSSWIFRLRGGVRFHDGKLLTAEDVRWSYQQYLDNIPEEQRIEGVESIDEHVIQLHLTSPCRLDDLAMPKIMPEGMGISPDQWIGTGPFQATQVEHSFWRLKVNPHYFAGRPFFGEIHIREYANPEELEKALLAGEVHFGIGVDVPGDDLAVKAEPTAQRYHLHFLLGDPLAQNYLLRKAIDLGLDREALAAVAGLKEPLYSNGPFDYVLNDRSPYPLLTPDQQAAKELLKGVPELGEPPFRIKCYGVIPENLAIAEAIVEQLNQLGIPSEIGEPAQALLVSRNTRTFEQECRLWSTHLSPVHNLSGYSNQMVDALIQQCLNTEPSSSRLQQLRRLIQQDLPDIPLFYREVPLTYTRRLRALENRIVLLGSLSEIHTWYLDQDTSVEETEDTRHQVRSASRGRNAGA